MSIADKITRLTTARGNIRTAITQKGGTSGTASGFEDFASEISTIPTPPPTQSKTVTPTKNGLTVTPDTGKVLSSVIVNGDSDLIPTNIKEGVNIFGVTGSVHEGITPSGSITLTANGTYDVTEKASAVVNVSGDVPTLIEKSVTANGTYTASTDNADGYSKVTVNVPSTPTQSKTVTPTAAGFTVTPDSGKVLSSVVVNGDTDLVASNVRKNVNIFGVTGTLEEGITPSGSLSITENGTYDVTDKASAVVNVPSTPHAPVITVHDTGLIDATCGGVQSQHILSSADDPDFVASNIKKGVKIFGYTGSYEGGTSYPTVTATENLTSASAIYQWFLGLGLDSSVVQLRLTGKSVWGSRQTIMTCRNSNSTGHTVYRGGPAQRLTIAAQSSTGTTGPQIYIGDKFECLPDNFA